MEGQLSLWDSNSISFGYIRRSGVTGSYVSSIFNFLCSLHRIFHSGFYSPTNGAWSFSFLYIFNPLSLVFLAKAIIIVERWYFIMVLTWISSFFFFTLQYFIGFSIYQHESTTGIHTRVLHPEPSSLLPPHSIPLGRPSAPAPSIQYHASNLDWRLVSYMILYMFQCHSPKSSHPLPLSQSPKTVLYISVSFAVLYTGLLLPSF